MVEKMKSNLGYTLCAGFGLLNLILMAFPYATAYVEYGSYEMSEGASGYTVMGTFDGGFGGVMSSLVLVLILIGGLAMLALGACGLLKAMGNLPGFPEEIGGLKTKQIAEYALLGMAGLHVLLLIFMFIFSLSNSESAYGYSAGVGLGFGLFFSLIVAGGAAGLYLWAKQNKPEMIEGDTQPAIAPATCAKCGAVLADGTKFCVACGTPVEQAPAQPEVPAQPEAPVAPVCSGCGAPVGADTKFCTTCGTPVNQD